MLSIDDMLFAMAAAGSFLPVGTLPASIFHFPTTSDLWAHPARTSKRHAVDKLNVFTVDSDVHHSFLVAIGLIAVRLGKQALNGFYRSFIERGPPGT